MNRRILFFVLSLMLPLVSATTSAAELEGWSDRLVIEASERTPAESANRLSQLLLINAELRLRDAESKEKNLRSESAKLEAELLARIDKKASVRSDLYKAQAMRELAEAIVREATARVERTEKGRVDEIEEAVAAEKRNQEALQELAEWMKLRNGYRVGVHYRVKN